MEHVPEIKPAQKKTPEQLEQDFKATVLQIRSKIERRDISPEEKGYLQELLAEFLRQAKGESKDFEIRFYDFVEETNEKRLREYASLLSLSPKDADETLPLENAEKVTRLYGRMRYKAAHRPNAKNLGPLPIDQEKIDLYSSSALNDLGDDQCAIFTYKHILKIPRKLGDGNCNLLIARIMMKNDEMVGKSGAMDPMSLLNMPEKLLPKMPDGRMAIALMHGNKDHDVHIGTLTDIITINEGGEEVKLFCELHESDGVEYSIFSPTGHRCPIFRGKMKRMHELDREERSGKIPKGSTDEYVKANFPPAFMNLFNHRRNQLRKLQFKTDREFYGVRSEDNPKGYVNLAVNMYWPPTYKLKIKPTEVAQI